MAFLESPVFYKPKEYTPKKLPQLTGDFSRDVQDILEERQAAPVALALEASGLKASIDEQIINTYGSIEDADVDLISAAMGSTEGAQLDEEREQTIRGTKQRTHDEALTKAGWQLWESRR